MNDDRWETVCLHLDEGWKGELTEKRALVYATFLKGLDFEMAMAAVRRLALNGQPWLPTVPELVAAARAVTEPPLPSWTEVWGHIEALMEGKAVETLPLVVDFVHREGLGRLRMTPFYDPDKGDMRIHQLKTRWLEFVDVQRERENARLALSSGPLVELERAERPQLEARGTSGPGWPD